MIIVMKESVSVDRRHAKSCLCLAFVLEDERALDFRALDHARTTHVVPVAVASLDEGVVAVGALV